MTWEELVNNLKGVEELTAKLCKVISVTEDECIVEPYDSTAQKEARLRAKTGITGGFLIKPAINSDVLVMFAEKGAIAFVVGYSQVASFKLKTDAKISISNSAQDLRQILLDLLQAIVNLKVATRSGPSTAVINAFDFVALNQRINLLFE